MPAATYDPALALDLLRHVEQHQGASVFPIDFRFANFTGPSGRSWSKDMARMTLMLLLEEGCIKGVQQAVFVFQIERLTVLGYERMNKLVEQFGSADHEQAELPPSYTVEGAKAVYAAIENLVEAGKRAYSLSVPIEAERILIRQGAGRISHADANRYVKDAIVGLVHEGKIEAYPEPRKDWIIKEPMPMAAMQKVFIVHGHDEAALQGLARFIEKLGLVAVVLKEQPDQGRTIIEKFEEHAGDVGFAVVLLTPDDVGGVATADTHTARARQNVVFELGYFAGKLGRGRVCLLRKGSIEIPSDLYGVIYTEMDAAEGWQKKLIGELKAAKIDVDVSRLWG